MVGHLALQQQLVASHVLLQLRQGATPIVTLVIIGRNVKHLTAMTTRFTTQEKSVILAGEPGVQVEQAEILCTVPFTGGFAHPSLCKTIKVMGFKLVFPFIFQVYENDSYCFNGIRMFSVCTWPDS